MRAALTLFLLQGCAQSPCGDDLEAVHIAGETFCLELANDEAERTQGLMFRDSIATHGGMLFVFPDVDLRSFWMKNCNTDMDLIFLDAQGRIVAAHRMKMEDPWNRNRETEAQYERRLQRFSSRLRAQYALEFAPGTLDRLGLKPGDKINLDLDRLRKLAE